MLLNAFMKVLMLWELKNSHQKHQKPIAKSDNSIEGCGVIEFDKRQNAMSRPLKGIKITITQDPQTGMRM